MTDTPAGPLGATPPGAPVSDRMQALLSRAVEDQVSEQRAVSTVLADLRGQVAALSEGVRVAASEATVERLGGVVSTVVADLRTSTSLLGQRIEALSKRVEAVAQDTAAPTEQAAVRLAGLQADIAAQSDAVTRMQYALESLGGFPAALASLQKDVAGLHDRLQPLAEVRADLGDIGARTASSLDALRPELDALRVKVDAIGVVPDPERVRDAVVGALTGRLDRLDEAAARPVVGPEVLRNGLGDLRAAIDGALGERLAVLGTGLGAVENRLGQIGERLSDVGDAAGGIPALSTDLTRLAARVEGLQALNDKLSAVGEGVAVLLERSMDEALARDIASLREDIEKLGERIAATAPPPVEDVAALVSQRVADRLVETLAPRIADVVLTRVSATLVTQLGEALSPRVTTDTEVVVRAATADSERRVLAHVDEAVLALAEALLRRRRGGRAATSEPAPETLAADAAPVAEPSVDEGSVAEAAVVQPAATADVPVQEIVDTLNAATAAPAPAAPTAPVPPAARPAVTTGLAPARAVDVSAAPAAVPVETEAAPAPEPETAPEPEVAQEPPGDQPANKGVTTPPVLEGPDVVKPAARRRSKAAAPTAKKANRPATKPAARPILDRTPDLDNGDIEPVRGGSARPRPAGRAAPPRPAQPSAAPTSAPTSEPKPEPTPTQAAPAQPPAAQPTAPQPTAPQPTPPQPTPPQPTPPAAAQPPAKRKPWWRPGG
ncbi:MAG: hypothetical protein JWM02_2789 [Frankiales bacterium]|nr:hypothetical protein [Frankiales bacterium]